MASVDYRVLNHFSLKLLVDTCQSGRNRTTRSSNYIKRHAYYNSNTSKRCCNSFRRQSCCRDAKTAYGIDDQFLNLFCIFQHKAVVLGLIGYLFFNFTDFSQLEIVGINYCWIEWCILLLCFNTLRWSSQLQHICGSLAVL